jgi:hypothetical protein
MDELLQKRYARACHAMQSGVAALMPSEETTPKHLRVGVNSAMSEHSALVELLIAKGVISREEYCVAVVESMEREGEAYARRVNIHFNADGKIGLR